MLHIMQMGLQVDMFERNRLISELKKEVSKFQIRLDMIAEAVWDRPLNPNSSKQLISFFYERMGLPKQYKFAKGKSHLSCDREALESLRSYRYARPIVDIILRIRELLKLIQSLETEIEPDGCMRTSINIAGTETGRVSSSQNAFETGGNLQNIAPRVRRIFRSRKGTKFAYIDLEQAEARIVGFLCWVYLGSDTYLRACESGDLHTLVATMVWPHLPWTGDLKKDREIADQQFYREFSYRDISKRMGHGSNYRGTPRTLSNLLKVPLPLVEAFQSGYFRGFPEIIEWHHYVAKCLQTEKMMTTILGRQRHFFDRSWTDETLREAIAFEPQSVCADHLNTLLLKLYVSDIDVNIVLQVHDAILLEYDEAREKELLSAVLHVMNSNDIIVGEKKLHIPSDAKVGWNWGDYHEIKNPFGMKKYKGHDDRVYKEPSILDRRLY